MVASMPTVEEEYRTLLPQLLSLYPAVGRSGLRFRETHQGVGHVAHGWYMRCHRGIEAVLLLEQANRQEEAAPIRRSVVEHVVGLKWLVEQGSIVADILRRGAAHDATKRKAAMQAANWTSVDLQLFDAVIDDARDLDRQHDVLLNFKPRCDRFGTPHDWTTYLTETRHCHPCWESAVAYLDLSSGNPVARSHPASLIDQAGFCAVHLYEALISINEIVDDQRLDGELDEICPRLHSIIVRQRRELGLLIPPELEADDAPRSEPRTGENLSGDQGRG